MRDEEVGQPELFLQVFEQVERLRLHRNVQRRNRFVAHDQPGAQGQRARDADALALPAAEGIRVAVHVLRLEAHCFEQFPDLRLEFRALDQSVDTQWLADDVHDGHPWVERGEGVLKNDLHLAPQRLHFLRGQFQDVDHLAAFTEPHLAGGRRVSAQNAAPGGRLAAA